MILSHRSRIYDSASMLKIVIKTFAHHCLVTASAVDDHQRRRKLMTFGTTPPPPQICHPNWAGSNCTVPANRRFSDAVSTRSEASQGCLCPWARARKYEHDTVMWPSMQPILLQYKLITARIQALLPKHNDLSALGVVHKSFLAPVSRRVQPSHRCDAGKLCTWLHSTLLSDLVSDRFGSAPLPC